MISSFSSRPMCELSDTGFRQREGMGSQTILNDNPAVALSLLNAYAIDVPHRSPDLTPVCLVVRYI
jgi:hypothetical protein